METSNKLVNDCENKYEEQYVAMKSFADHTIVAYGKNPSEVLNLACENGYVSPVIFFVPKKNITYFY